MDERKSEETTTTDSAVIAPSSIELGARLESALPPAALVVVLLENVIPPFELGPCGQEEFLYHVQKQTTSRRSTGRHARYGRGGIS